MNLWAAGIGFQFGCPNTILSFIFNLEYYKSSFGMYFATQRIDKMKNKDTKESEGFTKEEKRFEGESERATKTEVKKKLFILRMNMNIYTLMLECVTAMRVRHFYQLALRS